jgi:hypothetical protein
VFRAFCKGVNVTLVGSRVGEEEGKILEKVRGPTTIELEERQVLSLLASRKRVSH